MPLPAALAARLAKRGVIQARGKGSSKNAAPVSVHPPGYVEEVIAENYDDPEPIPPPTLAANIPKPSARSTPSSTAANLTHTFHRVGHIGCPNKCSIYHICSKYCVTRYGRGKPTPDPKTNSRRLRMLKKYPLPKGWAEIYDPGCARHYYWKPETDEVCWRSPRHPKAVISRPAAELRVELNAREKEKSSMPPPAAPGRLTDRERRITVDPKGRKRRQRENLDDLDPMDPAAYSDIPRGGWDAGLEKNTDAKTGVDVTASGPLFQSRPYPSPGAIMRANSEAKKGK